MIKTEQEANMSISPRQIFYDKTIDSIIVNLGNHRLEYELGNVKTEEDIMLMVGNLAEQDQVTEEAKAKFIWLAAKAKRIDLIGNEQ